MSLAHRKSSVLGFRLPLDLQLQLGRSGREYPLAQFLLRFTSQFVSGVRLWRPSPPPLPASPSARRWIRSSAVGTLRFHSVRGFRSWAGSETGGTPHSDPSRRAATPSHSSAPGDTPSPPSRCSRISTETRSTTPEVQVAGASGRG